MSHTDLERPEIYMPSSEVLGHVPDLPSRFSGIMDMDKDDMDRVAIYLNLGFHQRGSIDASTFQPPPNDTDNEIGNDAVDDIANDTANETVNDAVNDAGSDTGNEIGNDTGNEFSNDTGNNISNDIGNDDVGAADFANRPYMNRSMSLRVSRTRTKFFTVRDRGTKRRAVGKVRRNSAPSLISQKSDPLDRWNSRKGRKWSSIRAKNRYDELKKQFDDKKKVQRKMTISKAMGRIISGVMGMGSNAVADSEPDYSAPDVPLPVFISTPIRNSHRSIEDWLKQQNEVEIRPKDDDVSMGQVSSLEQPSQPIPPIARHTPPTNVRSLSRSTRSARSFRGILSILRDPAPELPSQPIQQFSIKPSQNTIRSFVNATPTPAAAPPLKRRFTSLRGSSQQQSIPSVAAPPLKRRFTSLRGSSQRQSIPPVPPIPSIYNVLQPISQNSNVMRSWVNMPTQDSRPQFTPSRQFQYLSPYSMIGSKTLSPTPSKTSLQPLYGQRLPNPYLQPKNGRLYRSSAEAFAAVMIKV